MRKCDNMRLKVTVCVKEKPCAFVVVEFFDCGAHGSVGLVGGMLFRVCCKIDSR